MFPPGPGTGDAAGFEIVRVAETPRRGRKYKNRGNEAKKYLKTKDITFLNGANYERFACKSARITRQLGLVIVGFGANEPKLQSRNGVQGHRQKVAWTGAERYWPGSNRKQGLNGTNPNPLPSPASGPESPTHPPGRRSAAGWRDKPAPREGLFINPPGAAL